ncbi:ephrin-B2a [Lepeophtheirus salmonis]|uniref:ephrin-B2a n=1 Tax=Lepeophtheirus salmonis TaxID=72036 RepID=UPI001AEB9EC4|nr:ephrin-A2-like [Lepeophtheirus salmonis]XP_040579781.1 ephrin-A2-like [Lepeophtheirus salmonis]
MGHLPHKHPHRTALSSTLFILIFIILPSEIHFVQSKELFNIYWNTSNPMFRKNLHQNVIDVNVGNHPWEYDQANIVCPTYGSGVREADIETFIIYNVSKEEYESCRIRNPNPRIIALCNSPYKAHYYTITFRSFTPTPGGLEFNPGQSYYFISTSSRNDLHRRVSGRCLSNNMKLTFKLAPLPSSAEDALKVPSINVPRITSSPSPSTKTDYNYYYEYPLNDIKNEPRPEIFLQDKKLKSSVKQEASVMSNARRVSEIGSPYIITIHFALLIHTLT